jgi:hypothetical protein
MVQSERNSCKVSRTQVGALCVYRCNAGRSEEKFLQKR